MKNFKNYLKIFLIINLMIFLIDLIEYYHWDLKHFSIERLAIIAIAALIFISLQVLIESLVDFYRNREQS